MRKKRSAFQILVNVTLLVAALVCVLPILNILALSLSQFICCGGGKGFSFACRLYGCNL